MEHSLNYIYIYDGILPNYIKKSIQNTINIDSDASIIFCNNQKQKIKGATSVDLKKVISSETQLIINKSFFESEKNPLWSRSLLRIFYLRDLLNYMNIDEFIHFDSDVLIYKPFNKIKYSFDKKKFNITPLSNNELIFGYSCGFKKDVYCSIADRAQEFLLNINDREARKMLSKELTEMKLLHNIFKQNKNLFNLLPVVPTNNEDIFDPASYGQYLGGTQKRFSKKFVDPNHIVGKEILNKTISPKLLNSSPKVLQNQDIIDIVNLHIHSKKINKFALK